MDNKTRWLHPTLTIVYPWALKIKNVNNCLSAKSICLADVSMPGVMGLKSPCAGVFWLAILVVVGSLFPLAVRMCTTYSSSRITRCHKAQSIIAKSYTLVTFQHFNFYFINKLYNYITFSHHHALPVPHPLCQHIPLGYFYAFRGYQNVCGKVNDTKYLVLVIIGSNINVLNIEQVTYY